METVITRDTDIIREYLAALDARTRGMSPFARLVATIKLSRLKRELQTGQIEATDEDLGALRREIDDRTQQSLVRRVESRPLGARISIFLMLVVGQQLALGLIALAAALFVRLGPVPKRWNPVLPHEDPGYLLVFCFFFFLVTPMLGLLVVFGGRFFGSWRKTVPGVLFIIAVSAVGTFLVFHNTESKNRVRHITSLEELARGRDVNVASYRQWVEANWLMSDPKFQRDYESYLRQGPGRWVTTRVYLDADTSNDFAWSDGIEALDEYLNGAQDPNGFREWLRYYLDRNRVYSTDRIDQEVSSITGPASQRFLGLWQVEPFLKERDQRLYAAYLGEIGRKMRLWGMAALGLYSLIALAIFLAGPAAGFWERMTAGGRGKRPLSGYGSESAAPPGSKSYAFPEQSEITSPPFFETPFRLLGRLHSGFMRLAASTLLLVFVFWAFVFAAQLSLTHRNPDTQVGLMNTFLLIGPPAESSGAFSRDPGASGTYTTVHRAALDIPSRADTPSRLAGLETQLEEGDYQTDRRFKEQYRSLSATQSDVSSLKNLTSQLQQTTSSGLPQQISQVGSQADAKAGQAIGDAAAARQMAQTVESQLSTKLKELEARTARASEEVGRIEAQATGIGTRTEKVEGDIISLAKQLEARTDELTNRTAKERDEDAARLAALQTVAFTSIVSELTASVDEVERRIGANLYRFFNKGDAQTEVDSLRFRIGAVIEQMKFFTSDPAKQALAQLEQLRSRVDQLSLRVK